MKVTLANLITSVGSVRLRLRDIDVTEEVLKFEYERLRGLRKRVGTLTTPINIYNVRVTAELTQDVVNAVMRTLCTVSSSGTYTASNLNSISSTITYEIQTLEGDKYKLDNGYISSVQLSVKADAIPMITIESIHTSMATISSVGNLSVQDFVRPTETSVSYYNGSSFTSVPTVSIEVRIDQALNRIDVVDKTYRFYSESLLISGNLLCEYNTTLYNFYRNGSSIDLRLSKTTAPTFNITLNGLYVEKADIFKEWKLMELSFVNGYVSTKEPIVYST
jgi:hypothetical protein